MFEGALQRWRRLFVMEAPPSTGLREGLQWLLFARLGVLFVALTGLVVQQAVGRASAHGAALLGYGLLALGFAFNLANAVALPRLRALPWVAGLHVLFDVSLTTTWLLFSGLRESLPALLYLVQILMVALILYQKGAWLSAAAACAAFGLVCAVVPLPNPWLTWAAYSALFLVLGLVGGYLSEELVRTTSSLEEKSRKIEHLRELHERILAHLPTGLLTVDDTLKVGFVNPAAEHILGRASAELVGAPLPVTLPALMPFFSQLETDDVKDDEVEGGRSSETSLSATRSPHPSFFVSARSGSGRTARLQQRVEIGHGREARVLRGDVAELPAGAGMSALVDEGAIGLRVLLFQDVTKLVHLEERLKSQEKLAAVGQLAAGIAHEIRNPLASMSASIEMLKGALPPGEQQAENRKLMDIAIREIDRLNGLVSEFLDFVKPEMIRQAPVDLAALLSELGTALRNTPDFRARLQLVEQSSPGAVALGSSEKLKQVAWNLLLNAAQAMAGKGTVEMGCGRVSEQWVKFWVCDQGAGMTDEVLGHLYEPFFTTKPKGTGLGLATAYKIVEAHHGQIRVQSTVGLGTRFEVHLPSA